MRPRDTSPEAYEIQMQIYRSMSPQRRLEVGIEVSETAFAVLETGIRMRHPDYTDDQVRWALFRLRIEDDDLFRRAWPNAPLLAP